MLRVDAVEDDHFQCTELAWSTYAELYFDDFPDWYIIEVKE